MALTTGTIQRRASSIKIDIIFNYMATTPVFKIAPTTQQYEWGKLGSTAKVAQFAAASQLSAFHVDESTPYAEVRLISPRKTSLTSSSSGWAPTPSHHPVSFPQTRSFQSISQSIQSSSENAPSTHSAHPTAIYLFYSRFYPSRKRSASRLILTRPPPRSSMQNSLKSTKVPRFIK